MERIGHIRFQSNDKMDFFHAAEVWMDGETFNDGHELTDRPFTDPGEPTIAGDPPWVTGVPPKMQPVNVDGDTGVIKGWLNGNGNDGFGYIVHVYVEYEVAEELMENNPDGEDTENETIESNT